MRKKRKSWAVVGVAFCLGGGLHAQDVLRLTITAFGGGPDSGREVCPSVKAGGVKGLRSPGNSFETQDSEPQLETVSGCADVKSAGNHSSDENVKATGLYNFE